ncbi:MAG: hypothetical protein R6V17_01045, partial [Halanaerobacter sp.]
MERLKKNFEYFDLILILSAIYILTNIIFFLPIKEVMHSLGIVSNNISLHFFVEFIMELVIVFICFNIFFISIYNYKL